MNLAAGWAHDLWIEFRDLLGIASRHFSQEGLKGWVAIFAQKIVFLFIHSPPQEKLL